MLSNIFLFGAMLGIGILMVWGASESDAMEGEDNV